MTTSKIAPRCIHGSRKQANSSKCMIKPASRREQPRINTHLSKYRRPECRKSANSSHVRRMRARGVKAVTEGTGKVPVQQWAEAARCKTPKGCVWCGAGLNLQRMVRQWCTGERLAVELYDGGPEAEGTGDRCVSKVRGWWGGRTRRRMRAKAGQREGV
jgi:hypothetical protein